MNQTEKDLVVARISLEKAIQNLAAVCGFLDVPGQYSEGGAMGV